MLRTLITMHKKSRVSRLGPQPLWYPYGSKYLLRRYCSLQIVTKVHNSKKVIGSIPFLKCKILRTRIFQKPLTFYMIAGLKRCRSSRISTLTWLRRHGPDHCSFQIVLIGPIGKKCQGDGDICEDQLPVEAMTFCFIHWIERVNILFSWVPLQDDVELVVDLDEEPIYVGEVWSSNHACGNVVWSQCMSPCEDKNFHVQFNIRILC